MDSWSQLIETLRLKRSRLTEEELKDFNAGLTSTVSGAQLETSSRGASTRQGLAMLLLELFRRNGSSGGMLT